MNRNQKLIQEIKDKINTIMALLNGLEFLVLQLELAMDEDNDSASTLVIPKEPPK